MAEVLQQDVVSIESAIQTPTRQEKHTAIFASSTIATSPSTPGPDSSPTPSATDTNPVTPSPITKHVNVAIEHETLDVVTKCSVIDKSVVHSVSLAARDAPPRPTKMRKQIHEAQNEASGGGDGHLSKSVCGNCHTIIFKDVFVSVQEKTVITNTAGLDLTQINTNFRDVPNEDIFHRVTRSILSEIQQSAGISTKPTLDLVGNLATTTRVAALIKSFVVENGMEIAKYVPELAQELQSTQHSLGRTKISRGRNSRREVVASTLTWKNPDRYSNILPVDIVRRLNDKCNNDKGSCVYDNVSGPKVRCSRGIKSLCSDTRYIFKQLAALPASRNLAEVVEAIKSVINKVACGRSHLGRTQNVLELMYDRFSRLPHDSDPVTDLEERKALRDWLIAMTSPLVDIVPRRTLRFIAQNAEVTSPSISSKKESGTVARSAVFDGMLAQHSATAFLFLLDAGQRPVDYNENAKLMKVPTSTHLNNKHFRRYSPASQKAVGDVVKSSLTSTDEAGYVYVYWHVGSFGYVKIGRTVCVLTRLDAWSSQCGFDLLEHKDKLPITRKVRYSRRLEKLIHTELSSYRYEEPECTGCGKSHNEWFEVHSDVAQAVVSKWTKWMQDEDPYDEDGSFKANTCLTWPGTKKCVQRPPIEPKVHFTRSKVRSMQRHDVLDHNPFAAGL